jgi:hypothetical protein
LLAQQIAVGHEVGTFSVLETQTGLRGEVHTTLVEEIEVIGFCVVDTIDDVLDHFHIFDQFDVQELDILGPVIDKLFAKICIQDYRLWRILGLKKLVVRTITEYAVESLVLGEIFLPAYLNLLLQFLEQRLVLKVNDLAMLPRAPTFPLHVPWKIKDGFFYALV